jgi:plastocyanin
MSNEADQSSLERPADETAQRATVAVAADKERAWHEWMGIGVALTGVLSILAIIVSIFALTSSNSSTTTVQMPAMNAGLTTGMGSSSMSSGMRAAMMGGSSESAYGASSSGKPVSMTLVMKSDTEKAKLGPDGKFHDAVIPANFTVHAGDTVHLTVYNYDDMPHTWTATSLGANTIIPGGSANAPSKTTFTFTVPSKPGNYLWWCAVPCDPYSMTHIGLMRGYVTVAA